MAESTLSKLKRQLHAANEKIKRLEWRCSEEASAREIVYQIELLTLIDMAINRIDEKECAPMAQKFTRGEIVNAKKSIASIKVLALQQLSAMHERIEQDVQETRERSGLL